MSPGFFHFWYAAWIEVVIITIIFLFPNTNSRYSEEKLFVVLKFLRISPVAFACSRMECQWKVTLIWFDLKNDIENSFKRKWWKMPWNSFYIKKIFFYVLWCVHIVSCFILYSCIHALFQWIQYHFFRLAIMIARIF